MDIKTGLSIYNKQWLIEPSAALQMLDFFDKVKEGERWSYGRAKGEENELSGYKIYQKFFANAGLIMAPESTWDMSDFKGFEGATIAVIPISGPLMKADFCGSFGTQTIGQLTKMAWNTQSVKTLLFVHDSPGGTVDGTESLANIIADCPKETISLVTGMMCSADMWIGGASDKVYASCQTDMIGSIGTMCSFYDNSKARESRGVVLREYYATASKDKNAAGREAQEGDGKKLIQEMLDPLNDVFLAAMKKNRPKISEEALTGKVYTAGAAKEMGLIDGIKSFEQLIDSVTKPRQSNSTFYQVIKTKNNMTTAEFKIENPTAYSEIFNAGMIQGVSHEKARVEGWQAWAEFDPEAVAAGIASGKEASPSDCSKMQAKAAAKYKLAMAEKDNAPALSLAAAPKTDAQADDMELEANTAAVLQAMGIKTTK